MVDIPILLSLNIQLKGRGDHFWKKKVSPIISDCSRGPYHPQWLRTLNPSCSFWRKNSLLFMYMNVDLPACVSPACPGEMSIWAVLARANRAEANSYPGQPIWERGCCLVVKKKKLHCSFKNTEQKCLSWSHDLAAGHWKISGVFIALLITLAEQLLKKVKGGVSAQLPV